jgi:hypothetical protein
VVLRQRGSVPASRTAPEASLTFDPGVAMADDAVAGLELAEVAGSSEPVAVRAEALLETLRRFVPFDGAWLALVDPQVPSYIAGASTELADSTLAFLAGPQPARDIELAGAHRAAPPVSPSDLPFPAVQLPTWAECLLPAGYREGLGVALFAPGGRHVGFLALLSGDREPPSQQTRQTLGWLVPVLAHGIDPLRSLSAAARLVHGATAGVVLHEAGGIEVLPGLHAHALLTAGSRRWRLLVRRSPRDRATRPSSGPEEAATHPGAMRASPCWPPPRTRPASSSGRCWSRSPVTCAGSPRASWRSWGC